MNSLGVEKKIESSIPVQARVSIVELAELAKYWESEGYEIRSMSQLISWSISIFYEVLKNNKLVSIEDMTVVEANRYLSRKSLYQRSMENRFRSKIATAIRFEGIREEGGDPKIVDPRSYNILHNKKSMKTLDNNVLDSKVREAIDMYHKMFPDSNNDGLPKHHYIDRVPEADVRDKIERIVIKERMSEEEIERKAEEINRSDEEERRKIDEFLKSSKNGKQFV